MSAADDERYRSLEKMLRLALYLKGKRLRPTINEMATFLACNRRTVIRYINVLERSKWPLPPLDTVGIRERLSAGGRKGGRHSKRRVETRLS